MATGIPTPDVAGNVLVYRSTDEGVTYASPTLLPAGDPAEGPMLILTSRCSYGMLVGGYWELIGATPRIVTSLLSDAALIVTPRCTGYGQVTYSLYSSDDDGSAWERAPSLATGGSNGRISMAMTVDDKGWYVATADHAFAESVLVLRHSADRGATWAIVANITRAPPEDVDGNLGFVGLQQRNQSFAVTFETVGDAGRIVHQYVATSHDGGHSWNISGVDPRPVWGASAFAFDGEHTWHVGSTYDWGNDTYQVYATALTPLKSAPVQLADFVPDAPLVAPAQAAMTLIDRDALAVWGDASGHQGSQLWASRLSLVPGVL